MAKKSKKTAAQAPSNGRSQQSSYPASDKGLPQQRTYTLQDYRLEKPNFDVRQARQGDKVRYEVAVDLAAPVPPIRDSKYLSKQQYLELYRWMLLNRKMETAL